MNGKQQETTFTPQVKICGITTIKEADWLNAVGADYAGFVFYERSRRNVSMMDAVMIKKSLYPSLKTVAVTVSPTIEQLRAIEVAGFDILQVHKELPLDVLRECRIPIWRAYNIAASRDVQTAEPATHISQTAGTSKGEDRMRSEESLTEQRERKQLEDRLIEAYVLDGIEFGSGKTFDWTDGSVKQIKALFGDKKLVLAGGLNLTNVAEGIRIFQPDIMDVSSGVENEYGSGKNEEKIKQFIRKVREKHE